VTLQHTHRHSIIQHLLGSGGGIDCFQAAKAVGESAHVIGVDMTTEMLEQARANKAKLGVDIVVFVWVRSNTYPRQMIVLE
jgi:ubiquinone/menaquinone biosynthesis C-methylase UbiE